MYLSFHILWRCTTSDLNYWCHFDTTHRVIEQWTSNALLYDRKMAVRLVFLTRTIFELNLKVILYLTLLSAHASGIHTFLTEWHKEIRFYLLNQTEVVQTVLVGCFISFCLCFRSIFLMVCPGLWSSFDR